ncbi:MAG: hypothetical protein J6J86_06690 [Lachnospiraceae bacterium]|nr:hypothetical protein [Lachnospiraceae bacterium]
MKKTKSKKELTGYAKDCARVSKAIIDVMVMSEEISEMDFSKSIRNDDDKELLLEIAKRFAKYVNDRMPVDLEIGEVQEMCNIINDLFSVCEENNWFE